MAKSHATISKKNYSALFRGFKISDYNLFDNNVSNFVHSNVLEQQIEHNFQQRIANVKHDNPFRSVKINLIKNQHREDLDALKALKKEKKSKKRKLTKDVETKLNEAFKNKKVKTMIDFDKNECNSKKSIVIKENTPLDVTSRFIKGKC